jgi:hypothetical protein
MPQPDLPRGSTGSPAKKKKKAKKQTPKQQSSLLSYKNNKQQVNEVMSRSYVGKRILLTSISLYGRANVPDGEEDLLFQYHIAKINDDNTTAVIEYDEKCVQEGHHVFTNYPDPQVEIPNYKLTTFKDDQELYLKHLGLGQKIVNEERIARKKKMLEDAAALLSDVSDLEVKIEDGLEIYDLMMDEFEPAGDLRPHEIASGKDAGKVIQKQQWSELLLKFLTLACFNHRTHYFVLTFVDSQL